MCDFIDYEYVCEVLGLCDPDFPSNLCSVNDGSDAAYRPSQCEDDSLKAVAEDWQSQIISPDFNFCTTFSQFCFPPPETFSTDMIPTIPSDLMIDYGDPFFEAPREGGSITFDLASDNMKLITCEFELVEPFSIAEEIVATAMVNR